jgi:hypothetical protein
MRDAKLAEAQAAQARSRIDGLKRQVNGKTPHFAQEKPQDRLATQPATQRAAASSAGQFVREGEGWDGLRIGGTPAEITAILGEPERQSTNDGLLWMVWRKAKGIDVLFDKGRAIEIRFDPGFAGTLPSGVGIGSRPSQVFDAYGQPRDTKLALGNDYPLDDDQVFYRLAIIPPASRIIYSETGVLFWFDATGKVSQFVVFSPYPAHRQVGSATTPAPMAVE